MMNFQARRRARKIIYSRLTILALLVLVIVAIGSVHGAYEKYKFSLEKRRESEKKLSDLNERVSRLQKDTEKLSSERGEEEVLRTKFDVAKPGENVIVIVDESTGSEASEGEEAAGGKSWLDSLFGR